MSEIDYQALKTVLAGLPEGLSSAAAAEALNALTVQRARPIRAVEIKKLWSRWMVLARCELFVIDNSPAALGDAYTPEMHMLRVVCQATASNLLRDIFADLDMTEPEAVKDANDYLAALVAAGVLSEQQRDATLALGTVDRLAREEWGFSGEVSYTDVEIARGK